MRCADLVVWSRIYVGVALLSDQLPSRQETDSQQSITSIVQVRRLSLLVWNIAGIRRVGLGGGATVAAGVGAPWCGSSFGQTSLAPIDMMKLALSTALAPARPVSHASLLCFVEGTALIDWLAGCCR